MNYLNKQKICFFITLLISLLTLIYVFLDFNEPYIMLKDVGRTVCINQWNIDHIRILKNESKNENENKYSGYLYNKHKLRTNANNLKNQYYN